MTDFITVNHSVAGQMMIEACQMFVFFQWLGQFLYSGDCCHTDNISVTIY